MAASIPMHVVQLASIDDRKAVIAEWLPAGLSPADADTLEEEMLGDDFDPSRWHAVVDNNNGMTIAIYDVRSVPLQSPNYHKSLHIHFAPGLNPQDWENSGETPENIDAILDTTVPAMYMAFWHLVQQTTQNNDHMVKIFSDHPMRLLLFREFAKALAELAPTQYETRTYKKWVEIKHLQGGRHGA